MALTIMTNALSTAAQRNLSKTEESLGSTMQKLASGSRIVVAADDPAGLAISDNMNSTLRSLNQAMRNTSDGISLIQVFEGGTNEITNMLTRIRELAIESSSDTLGDKERDLLDNEVQELKLEISRIAKSTVYGGRELLTGADLRVQFQVGTGNDDEKDRITFSPGPSNLTSDGLGVGDLSINNKESAQESLETIDKALTHVNVIRARVGASQNRLQTTFNSQSIYYENLSLAKSRIKDADMALETTNYTKEQILRQAGVSVLQQANQTPQLALQLLHS